MMRAYRLRDQPHSVDEIDGALAVWTPQRPSEFVAPGLNAPLLGAWEWIRRRSPAVAAAYDAFTRAGWAFVAEDDPIVQRGIDTLRRPTCRVYLHPDGPLTLGPPQVVVRLTDDAPESELDQLLARHELRLVSRLRFGGGFYVLGGRPSASPLDLAAALSAERSIVAYAEPHMLEHWPARTADPGLVKQWQWDNIGAKQAWLKTRGENTVIAIIDHGFHLSMIDLAGAVVDSAAFFRLKPSGDVQFFGTTVGMPQDAHGTLCAGMALARRDNGSAGCGVAPEARLLPIACGEAEISSQVMLARAIAYATNPRIESGDALTPADVISCSLGSTPSKLESVLQAALNDAFNKGRDMLGIPMFWAVDNEQVDLALDEVANSILVTAVGRSDKQDRRGPCASGDHLAFLAPGQGVFSLLPDDTVGVASGTSLAAPVAAGIGALVISLDRTLLAREVVDILKRSCDRPTSAHGNLPDAQHGFGRVNAEKAVNLASP